jgi:NitT/TauT family transport system substrate-binding protein
MTAPAPGARVRQQVARMARRLGAAALGLGIAVAALAPAEAQDKPLKKVTIGVGTQVLNIGYPWLMMALALDYWKQEGYDVQVVPMGASLQIVQQLLAGNVQFGQINASIVVQSNVANAIPVRTVMENGIVDWSVVALADGPIKTMADLKGKPIGVYSLASGGVPFLRAYLRANGIDPEADVQLIAVGAGAPALESLRSGKMSALLFWASAIAGFENVGVKLTKFRSPDWRDYPDFSLVSIQKVIDQDPAMVEAIARGAAKASEFAVANPDCVRRLQWAHWPDTKPTGAPDEATLVAWDMHNLAAQLDTMQGAQTKNGGRLWGNTSAESFGKLQAFMLDAKLIDKAIADTSFIIATPGFFEKINDFDHAAVRAQAAACPMK